MSNYQRLISYIYTYEGGIKGKNIGFAKLETRGPQCRITVNVKKIFVGGNPIGVYLLSEKKEWRIGTLFVRNGAGEFRTTVSSADVESSGLGIEAFYGLSVHDVESTWRSYTTIWEDAVSHAAEVELADVTAENARKKQTPEEVEQEIKLQNTLPVSREIEEALEHEPDKKSGQEDVGQDAGQDASAPMNQVRTEVTIEARTERNTETVDSVAREPVEPMMREPSEPGETSALPSVQGEDGQTGTIAGKEIVEGPEGENEVTADRTPEPSEQPVVIKELKNRHRDWSAAAVHNLRESLLRDQAAVSAPAKVSSAAVQVKEEPGSDCRAPMGAPGRRQPSSSMLQNRGVCQQPADSIPAHQEEKETITQSEMWEQLQKKYPKILAFDYADGCEVLTIKPQDIGLLPRETWLFGNNSFLLHGYYNYRYLILARLNNPGGKPRFLLGVPGHYYSNEKYMAGMFGFPDFVLAKKQRPGDGRFGYWYTDIKMGD